ncbi:MAG: hypothetical protein U9N52_10080 [Campylobacterota bacterium]|nr:hypothetical protein [Campylobacterota bacterium]
MIKNNKEAKSLVDASQKMLDEANSDIAQNDNRVCENISKYANLRDDVLEKSLKRFDTTYLNIQNCTFKGADITQLDDEMEDIKVHFEEKLPEISSLEISKINTALASSIFIGVFTALAIIAILLFLGMQAMNLTMNPNQLPTCEQLEPIFQFYGDLILPNRGDMLEGLVFITLIPTLIGLFIALTRYHRRSAVNLNTAQSLFEAAKIQHVEKMAQNQKIMTLCQYTQKLDEVLRTLQVYLDEYNAIMRRIVHIEGEDFGNYSIPSRQKIETAALLYKTTRSLMNTDIITDEGDLNAQSRMNLETAITRLDERFNDDQR